MNEARMMTLEHVEAPGQQNEAAPRASPRLKRIDDRTLAERPVCEIRIAPHELAPVLLRRCCKRAAQMQVERVAPVERAFGQFNVRRAFIRHGPTPLRTSRSKGRAHRRSQPR